MPHPFDRMHSVPDYEHLLDVVEDIDAIEVFNPRVAFSAFNEEAARFAAKYRIVAGAGSDSHVAQGLGSVKIRMRDFDGPEEFLESLRDADIVRKRPVAPLRAGAEVPPDAPARSDALESDRRPGRQSAPVQDGARHRRRDSREVPRARDPRAEPAHARDPGVPLCPRGNLMPVLGSGHPQADIMLLKFAPMPSEIEEGVAFYGRAGSALMKSFKRLGIDPLAVYGTVFVKCPVHDTDESAPACRARVLEEIAIVQPRIVVVMGDEALEELNDLRVPLAQARGLPGELQRLTPSIEALTCRTSTARSTTRARSASSGPPSGRLGDWYADFPPY